MAPLPKLLQLAGQVEAVTTLELKTAWQCPVRYNRTIAITRKRGAQMANGDPLVYAIKDPLELNLSYMPFIKNGGLFIPTSNNYSLGDKVMVELQLPSKKDSLRIEAKVIWITPKNALHHVLPGIGVQFSSADAKVIRVQIESLLDPAMEVGGYTYGITEGLKGQKK